VNRSIARRSASRVAVAAGFGAALLMTAGAGISLLGDIGRVQANERRAATLEGQRRGLLGGRPPATEAVAERLRAAREEAGRGADALALAVLGPERPDQPERLEQSERLAMPEGLPSAGLLQSRLRAREESVSGRADAFFDLAWFAEEMRATAAAANVELGPREAFGFAEHAEGAPRSEDVPRIERQRERIEHLLRGLFAAGPARLEHIRRERPGPGAPGRASRGLDSGAERDFFDPDPGRLLRRHRNMDTLAFQIAFVATGAGTLRGFLNGLLADRAEWVVRSVEVKALAAGPGLDADRLEARPLRVELVVESIEALRRSGSSAEERS